MKIAAVKLLCTKEVADRIGVVAKTAAKMMRSNEIQAFKQGGDWRATELHVELYVTRKLHERAAEIAVTQISEKRRIA